MNANRELTDEFYYELKKGNRIMFVYVDEDKYIGEVSLVF